MRLLVAGAAEVDAGKTTFSVGLLERVGGVGFKPRASNDYWFDHDDYQRATREGRLYGKDARRLAAASRGDRRPEGINPIHRLWRPTPGETGLLGRTDREFVCDRVGGEYVVNATADVPRSVRERLPVSEAVSVADAATLDDVAAETHLPALSAAADRIRGTDRAVVESYGDIAVPIRGLGFDAVAVVEPGRARIYDGPAYVDANRTVDADVEGQLEQPVGAVVAGLDPVAAVRLPPLCGDRRSDPAAVADAYELAYDALIGAAAG